MVFQHFPGTDTGDLRRKKIPEDVVHLPGKPDSELIGARKEWENDVEILHGFHELKRCSTSTDEPKIRKLYYQTFTPKDMKKIKRVVVLFHGISDHGGWLLFNVATQLVKLEDCAVIVHDQPGHGRSDGLHVYIPDWHEFVDDSIDFVENFAIPQRDEWGNSLKLFGWGESMGGGVLTTLCIRKPEMFDGVVLSAPMIAVSDNMKPPWIVSQILRGIVAPLLPTWPITPSKDVLQNCWRDPEMVAVGRANPLTLPTGAKHRLATAASLAFQCPEWLETRLGDFTTPVMIMHGSADVVTDPLLSKRLYEQAASTDKHFEMVDDAWHAEMFHGGPKCRDQVEKCFKTMSQWMAARS